MKSEPPSIHSRDPLRLAKERYEKQQDQIGIDHTLQFEVSRKILAIDPAQAHPAGEIAARRGARG